MKFHIFVFFAFIIFIGSVFSVPAQVDSVLGQVTSSGADSFAGGISGDGRFIVFESTGNIATVRPRNTDGNSEIFLFDYAQRQIFQITDTKSLLTNPANAPTFDNVKVAILNIRPVISNRIGDNGRYWIAFGSNATCAYPGNGTITAITSITNPGNFDANNPIEPGSEPPVSLCISGTGTNATNNLVNDGNTELWLYEVPAVAPVADLSAGDEIPLTDLSLGTFTRVTNSLPSRLPVAGTSSTTPIIADDNHDASINDNGNFIAFTSTRDLVPCQPPNTPSETCGNASPQNNDEIFVHRRAAGSTLQLTATPRGTISRPIVNLFPSISGNGLRIAFSSNANNPISGMNNNGNADNNQEVFYADIDASGVIGSRVQLTTTTRTNPGDVVNVWSPGRRISRDGNLIAFDSFADLTNENGGANQPGFATFLYDLDAPTTPAIRRILARSNADSGASGGDIQRYPGFTDYDANDAAQTLVFTTRMNIKADGTIPTNADEGLNNIAARPAQIYSLPITAFTPPAPPPATSVTRLTKLPTPNFFLASIQALPSNSRRRITFNLGQTETGTGNSPDLLTEVYYYLLPVAVNEIASNLSFETGASRILVSPSPVPTPSPTATPTPTPTPSPSPTATPTPTPQTPPAVQGVSPGMLAVVKYNARTFTPVVPRSAVGSLERRFTLPIELSGVTVTVNGAAAGIKSVNRVQNEREVEFVVPPVIAATTAGTSHPIVINDNGTLIKGSITVVPTRPDIFTTLPIPGPGGRARIFNATNRVLTTEPFTITTFKLRGSRRVPSVLRIHMTGIQNLTLANSIFTLRIGNVTIPPANVTTGAVLFAPGVYTIDFALPAELAGAGDQPIVFTAVIEGVTYTSRLADTAPRLFIL